MSLAAQATAVKAQRAAASRRGSADLNWPSRPVRPRARRPRV